MGNLERAEQSGCRKRSPEYFDQSFATSSSVLRQIAKDVIDNLHSYNIDFLGLIQKTHSCREKGEAELLLSQLHEASIKLYSEAHENRKTGNKDREFASARLLNAATTRARRLNEAFSLFETGHIDQLEQHLVEINAQENELDTQAVAFALDHAARAHTHDRSWAWVSLPTFERQHYGRVLIRLIKAPNSPYPILITQPTFIDKRWTLLHTHGQNWSFSRPLGEEQDNTHLNTLWLPTDKTVFPLQRYDRHPYRNTVVAIPPKSIHGISGMRDETANNHSKFGENSCLHIYYPSLSLADELKESPFVKEDTRFFTNYDMVVFDTKSHDIWTGGKGAWPCRTETCNGVCFQENDPRQYHLDPQLVYEWLLTGTPQQAEEYSF